MTPTRFYLSIFFAGALAGGAGLGGFLMFVGILTATAKVVIH